MATLSNPTFQIDILTGMPNDYRVSGTVHVELTPLEMFFINMGNPLQLQSNLWGDDTSSLAHRDSPFPPSCWATDDLLSSFTTQSITASGTYRFEATVPRWILNEDTPWEGERDEVYNRFRLGSGSNVLPLDTSTYSPTITGLF